MKITDVTTVIVNVPYKHPEHWSFGTRIGSSPLIIQIHTDEGVIGIGEASAPFTSMSLDALIKHEVKPLLLGEDPMRIERLMKKIQGNGLLWCPDLAVFVTSGVEIALWDIVGKVCGQPVHTLLGGRYRSTIEFGIYLFSDEADAMARKAKEFSDDGFNCVKFKVGMDPETDMARLAAVRKAVGSSEKIIVDANQAWTPGTALSMIRRMAKYDPFFVEQPIRKDDLSGMSELRRRVDVPIGANEMVFTVQDALAVIRAEAADVIVTDIHLPGGILECKKVAAVCEAADIPVLVHSGGELGIATAAILQVVAATPNFIYPNDTYYPELTDDIVCEKLELDHGTMMVPMKPGLGVTIDQEKLTKYASAEYYHAYGEEGRDDWIPTAARY